MGSGRQVAELVLDAEMVERPARLLAVVRDREYMENRRPSSHRPPSVPLVAKRLEDPVHLLDPGTSSQGGRLEAGNFLPRDLRHPEHDIRLLKVPSPSRLAPATTFSPESGAYLQPEPLAPSRSSFP